MGDTQFIYYFHYLSAFGTIERLKIEHALYSIPVHDLVSLPRMCEGMLPQTLRDGLPSLAAVICSIGRERFDYLLECARRNNHPAFPALVRVRSLLSDPPPGIPATSNTLRVFIMRHAPRTHDCTFNGPLHHSGLEMAESVSPYLARIAPIRIFSSPFLRCLQTVAPTVQKLGMTVATDIALSELLADDRFGPTPPPDSDLPDVRARLQAVTAVDPLYVSSILAGQLRYPESLAALQQRVMMFLRRLFGLVCGGSRVLVCTHMHIVNVLLCAADPSRDPNELVAAGAVAEVEIIPQDDRVKVELVQPPHIPNEHTAEWRPLMGVPPMG